MDFNPAWFFLLTLLINIILGVYKLNVSDFDDNASKVLPMLFQLIRRSLRFNLNKTSLFEDVWDKDDGRYS